MTSIKFIYYGVWKKPKKTGISMHETQNKKQENKWLDGKVYLN